MERMQPKRTIYRKAIPIAFSDFDNNDDQDIYTQKGGGLIQLISLRTASSKASAKMCFARLLLLKIE